MAIENIITDLFQSLTDVIDSQIGSNVTAITSVIAPAMGAAVTLYFVFVVYKIIYTNNEMFIGEVVKNVLALSAVAAFAMSTPYYLQYVVPFVQGSGDQISSALTGSPASGTALDSMIANVKTSLDSMIEKMDFSLTGNWSVSFKALYAIVLIYVGSFIFIFYAAAYLLVAKFMVGLLLSVGTIFISFAFFPVTRGYFTSWCGQCLNYIMLCIMYSITLGVLNKFITSKFDLSHLGVESSFQIIIIFFISVFVIQQIGVLVSSLTGGMGINGLTGAANSMVGGAAKFSGVNMASRAAGSWAGGKAQSAGSVVSNFLKNSMKG